jgi:hypothetical protein
MTNLNASIERSERLKSSSRRDPKHGLLPQGALTKQRVFGGSRSAEASRSTVGVSHAARMASDTSISVCYRASVIPFGRVQAVVREPSSDQCTSQAAGDHQRRAIDDVSTLGLNVRLRVAELAFTFPEGRDEILDDGVIPIGGEPRHRVLS